MSDQERERTTPMTDDPEVAAHKAKPYGDDEPESEGAERRETDDESDVEAHRQKA